MATIKVPPFTSNYRHLCARYIRRSCFLWTHGNMSAFVCLHAPAFEVEPAILIIIMIHASFLNSYT